MAQIAVGIVHDLLLMIFVLWPISFAGCCYFGRTLAARLGYALLLIVYSGAVFWCLGWPVTYSGLFTGGWLAQIMYGLIIAVICALVIISVSIVATDRRHKKYSRM